MNLRKFFNKPNNEQKQQIEADKKTILSKCGAIASKEYNEQRENKKSHDGECPKCRARVDDIVNKIRQVHGNGSVGGSFSLGFGSVSGYFSLDTDEVNHCNKCGNEWKKYKVKYIGEKDVLKQTLYYLECIIKDKNETKYSWKTEAVQSFANCSAEAIFLLIEENRNDLYSSIPDFLTLGRLRKYYYSVYDDPENMKELEKLW